MERKPLSTPGNIFGAVVLLVVVPLGLYIGGYFALGKYHNYGRPLGLVFRDYASDWLAYGYRPMMHLEAAVTGQEVWSSGPSMSYGSEGEVLPTYGIGRYFAG